jgi:FdhE protein
MSVRSPFVWVDYHVVYCRDHSELLERSCRLGNRKDGESAILRLEEAEAQEPVLANHYRFYRTIFELQDAAKRDINETLELMDEEILQARAAQGLPQLEFSQLPLQSDRFQGLVTDLAEALVKYRNEEGEDDDAMEPGSVDWISVAKERFALERDDEDDPDIVELATDLALMPYLEWASEQIAPYLKEVRWRHGNCPVCGGEPNFAYLEEEAGERWLVCSRCRAEWRHNRLICPFCENDDHTKLRYHPAGNNDEYRLYLCDACQRYLKAVDLRKTGDKAVLSVEPILTWSLDMAAREKGYK